jgi:DNA ligase (NAD+)
MSKIKNRIEYLVDQVQKHNYNYWVLNTPEISDYEFDQIIQELKYLDPDNPAINYLHNITLNQPKIKHDPPMLSLDKVYSKDDLIKWAKKVARDKDEIFILEPKLDGIAAKLDKDNFTLSTAGDTGYIGENITNKLPLIKLKTKNDNFQNYVLGEIVFNKNDFKQNKHKILRKNGKEYKIPRTAVIGLLSLDYINPDHYKTLTFLDYKLFSYECTINHLENIDWDKYIQSLKEWEYPIDGLVLKLKDRKYFDSLGYTSHHYKGQMSLKLGNPTGITKLIDIELSSGKGSITPIGIVETIEIDGIDNSKASLHNYKYILDKDIHINDEIEIERCGEIIPQFKRIITKAENRKSIKDLLFCPDCNSQLIYEEPNLKCINSNCKGRLIRILSDAVVRIGIEELGRGTIKKMVNELNITSLNQILNLTYDDVVKLSGFATRSAMNIINEINKVKQADIYDYNILASFNIPGIGITLSKKLLSKYTIYELINMTVEQLVNIENIGPERAKLIYNFFIDEKEVFDTIYNSFNVVESKNINQNKTIINICFTGKNDNSRSYWVKLAESNRFNFIKSVTKEVNILVTNDINSNSNKIKNAKKYGCKIITYEQFQQLLKK